MKRTILGHLLFVALLAAAPLMPRAAAQSPQEGPDALLTRIAQAQRVPAGGEARYAFRQVKHSPLLAADAVSRGTMSVRGVRSMTWRYSEPMDMTLVVEGDSVYTLVGGLRAPLAGTRGKMVRSLVEMIVRLADGSSLEDAALFDRQVERQGRLYRVVLTPKRRDLKRMMQRAELTFDSESLRIRTVTLTERGEDTYTHLEFTEL